MSAPRPKVAIVGAGPAGFYALEALLVAEAVRGVDLFNRPPTPYGLVRDGVAPDHQQIKSVTKAYAKLLARPEVRYFGNVTLGEDISVEELRGAYDQIVYAVGAQADRQLGIPGEELDGSHSATAFVGWYNGMPEYSRANFDLSHDHVVVVGNGNVAIDVARILVIERERLARTDIADHALNVLRKSKVRRVTLLGRRGPAQASFTNPELREFGRLDGVSVDVAKDELELDRKSQALVEGDRMRQRNMKTLAEYAERTPGEPTGTERWTVGFRFLVSPVEILGEEGAVTGVRIEKNRLVSENDGSGGTSWAQGTGETELIGCGMVLRSVGYRGTPIPGVPFDERRCIVPNNAGRVLGKDGRHLPGEYVVGWAKRGPSGVIGTNKADAKATASVMAEDREAGILTNHNDKDADITTILKERGVRWVDKEGWARLDEYERARGAAEGRPRVKICSLEEMLAVANPG